MMVLLPDSPANEEDINGADFAMQQKSYRNRKNLRGTKTPDFPSKPWTYVG
jgi:hypothetical protein